MTIYAPAAQSSARSALLGSFDFGTVEQRIVGSIRGLSFDSPHPPTPPTPDLTPNNYILLSNSPSTIEAEITLINLPLFPASILKTNVGKEQAIALQELWLNIIISACTALFHRQKEGLCNAFDPLVGDTNCQTHSFAFIENYPVFMIRQAGLSNEAAQFLKELPQRMDDWTVGSLTKAINHSGFIKFLQKQEKGMEVSYKQLKKEQQDTKKKCDLLLPFDKHDKSSTNDYGQIDLPFMYNLMQMHLLSIMKSTPDQTPHKKKALGSFYQKLDANHLLSHFAKIEILDSGNYSYFIPASYSPFCLLQQPSTIKKEEVEEIAKHSQMMVMDRSISFLMKGQKFGNNGVLELIKDEMRIDPNSKRKYVSCHLTMKALLDFSRYKRQLILVKTDLYNEKTDLKGRSLLLFRANSSSSNERFQFLGFTQAALHPYFEQIAWVFKGSSRCEENNTIGTEFYEKRFNKEKLENIIDTNTAQHAQFSGTFRKESLKDFTANETIQGLSATAKSIGCHESNASLFLLNHVYSEIIAVEFRKCEEINNRCQVTFSNL